METTLQERQRIASPLAAVALIAFGGLALFILKAVGCPLAGCGSAMIAFIAAIALAVGLGAIMSYADRRRDCEVSHRRC